MTSKRRRQLLALLLRDGKVIFQTTRARDAGTGAELRELLTERECVWTPVQVRGHGVETWYRAHGQRIMCRHHSDLASNKYCRECGHPVRVGPAE